MKEIDPNLPVNKKAKFVVSKSKDQWCKFNYGSMLASPIPLPTTTLKAIGSKRIDLTGRKKGRLTVVGLSASFRGVSRKGLRWVVRCSCGMYEIRTEKTIKKGSDKDMCQRCNDVRYLKRLSDLLQSKMDN